MAVNSVLYLHKISRVVKKPVLNIKSGQKKFIRKQELIKNTCFDRITFI
jgi:hypothetical protein